MVAISPKAPVTVFARLEIKLWLSTRADRYFRLLVSELLVILSWDDNSCLAFLRSLDNLLLTSSFFLRSFLARSEI